MWGMRWYVPHNERTIIMLCVATMLKLVKEYIMVGEILIGLVSLMVLALPFVMCGLMIMDGVMGALWRKERENA